jgi:excisionase family DNA binding protein
MTTEDNTDELLSVVAAAALLGIEVSTLRAWICQKKITYVKIGRLVKLRRRSDIEAFIASRVVVAEK